MSNNRLSHERSISAQRSFTLWHEMFKVVYFCGSVTFCVSQELLFVIRTDLFFLLGINFGDFQKVPSQPRDKGPFISELKQR